MIDIKRIIEATAVYFDLNRIITVSISEEDWRRLSCSHYEEADFFIFIKKGLEVIRIPLILYD